MPTATKKPKKSKPKEFRDLKSLGKALGTKAPKKDKPAKAKPTAVFLPSDTDAMVELRTMATTIRGLRHKEDGLAGELKEVRARITTLLDQEQILILDGQKGQTRLSFSEGENTGTTKADVKRAATKAAHAPVEEWSETVHEGRTLRVLRRGEEFHASIPDAGGNADARFGPFKSFNGAAEKAFEAAGFNAAAVKAAKFTPWKPPVEKNGAASPAKPGALGVEATVANHILRVRPHMGSFQVHSIDLGGENAVEGEGDLEEKFVGDFKTEQVAKNAALDSVKHHGEQPEWKAIGAK